MRNAYATRRTAPDGYQAITKPLARQYFDAGVPVTLAGNNVNNCHIFDGWHLGATVQRMRGERQTFDDICRNMLSYLEPELGYYLVYYIQKGVAHVLSRTA